MTLQAYTPVIPALERLRQKEGVKSPDWAIYDGPVSKIKTKKSYPSKVAEINFLSTNYKAGYVTLPGLTFLTGEIVNRREKRRKSSSPSQT